MGEQSGICEVCGKPSHHAYRFCSEHGGATLTNWKDALNPREREQIRACQAYAEQFESSGLPGHGLFVLVAKLIKFLDSQAVP